MSQDLRSLINNLVSESINKELVKPSKRDLLDALDHASSVLNDDEQLSLDQFELKFLGNLSVDQLKNYDDIDPWLDLSSDDKGDYSSFRGSEWQQRSKSWQSQGIPPIVIVSTANGTVVGDGRGRINYANMMGMKVPTWELSQIDELDEADSNTEFQDEYLSPNQIYDGDTPHESEMIWNYLGYDEMDEKFKVVTVNPVVLFKTFKPDGTQTLEEVYENHATKDQKRLVASLMKNIQKVAKEAVLIVSGDELVDGFHRTVALAKKKVTSVKAIDLDQPEIIDEANAVGGGLIVGAGMGNAGTDSSKNLLWSGDKPLKEMSESWFLRNAEDKVPTEEFGFFYHATNRDNLFGIIETGFLETHPPNYGTDQDEWPDESVENRSYFGTSLRHVESYFPAEGEPELLRVPKDAAKFKLEKYTKDIYTQEDIPASKIQVWSKDQGVWIGLNQVQLNEVVGGRPISSGKKLLLLVHPDIVFEMSTSSMQSYFKKIEDEVLGFDHVITHMFYSPEFKPEWLSKDETHNHIFTNFMKMIRRNSHLVKWDNPRFMASFKQELPYYLIDNPGTVIYLAGGYKDLCVKATHEMMKDKLGSIIRDTGATVACYEPLMISNRNSVLEHVIENVLDKMKQKHVGGADRKAPYGDTYVGFSSSSSEDETGRSKQAGIVKKVNKNLNKKPYSLHDPPSMGISERTLYHGTLIDNEASIRSLGLYPTVGEFIKQMYAVEIEDDGLDLKQHALVYAADKNSLQKSLNAIIAQVGNKLGKTFHSVTEEDIRNHGLLAVIKDGESAMKQAGSRDDGFESDYQFLEPEDWYSDDSVGIDYFLKGSALLKFFKRQGLSVESPEKKREELYHLARKARPEMSEKDLRNAVANINVNDLNKYVDNYKHHLAQKK